MGGRTPASGYLLQTELSGNKLCAEEELCAGASPGTAAVSRGRTKRAELVPGCYGTQLSLLVYSGLSDADTVIGPWSVVSCEQF